MHVLAVEHLHAKIARRLPDVVFHAADGRLVIWELKTGRAVDTNNPTNREKRDRALKNTPSGTLYEYIQVYEDE